jgi:hypothetical protein
MTRQEYIAAFPNYCRKCDGWGLHKTFKPNFQFWDCECVVAGICPRCGSKSTLDFARMCSRCQWNMEDQDRGLPGSNVV